MSQKITKITTGTTDRPKQKTLEQVFAETAEELERSIVHHGRWQDYTPEEVMRAVRGEFEEVYKAYHKGDLTSPHGMIEELRQLMVVSFKGVVILGELSGTA